MQNPDRSANRTKQEKIKESSHFLRGTIASELASDNERFSDEDGSILKFHGTYQQDDRDTRRTGKKYIFMVRTKVPGGRLSAAQFLKELELGDRFGNKTLRITTRQGLQLHGILKHDLHDVLYEINCCHLTSLGACGDVVRNVMCCPAPHRGNPVLDSMQATAAEIAAHFTPQATAYREIWINGEKAGRIPGDEARADIEPLYGNTYLPRKFKIGMALPHDNCTEVHTHDAGLLAAVEDGRIRGYNLLVGGGLGVTPAVQSTFPRLADPLAFVTPDQVLRVLTAIVQVQRDFGNRESRRHARMKYLLHEWGIARFRAKVEEYLGEETLEPARELDVWGVDDHLGWHAQGDGRYYYGLFVENGRIQNTQYAQLKTGLRVVLERFSPEVRLTPQQSLLLCDLEADHQQELERILADHGILTHDNVSEVRRHALACPALPTCGLAITESERIAPRVIDQLERLLRDLGLDQETLTVRMTGCPNGCSRPYTADIGLVGKAVGKYTVLVGGRRLGDRLNFVYRDEVPAESIADVLLPLFVYYRRDRFAEETLGDFCHRQGAAALGRFDDWWRNAKECPDG